MSVIKSANVIIKKYVTIVTARNHRIDVYENGYMEMLDESIDEFVDMYGIQYRYTEEEIDEIRNAGIEMLRGL